MCLWTGLGRHPFHTDLQLYRLAVKIKSHTKKVLVYDAITHFVHSVCWVFSCCLVTHVYIAHSVCSYIPHGCFPALLPLLGWLCSFIKKEVIFVDLTEQLDNRMRTPCLSKINYAGWPLGALWLFSLNYFLLLMAGLFSSALKRLPLAQEGNQELDRSERRS